MKIPFLKQKQFINLSEYKINPVQHFTIRPTKKKVALAIGLASMSFIIPDASIGLMLSGFALSPLTLGNSLSLKRDRVKAKLIKKWYQLK